MHITHPPRIAPTLLLASLLTLASCKGSEANATPPPPPPGHGAEIANEFTVEAQVVSVSPAERLVTLRREDGAQFDGLASHGVRNLDQIAGGDAQRVSYKQVLRAELKPGEVSAGSPRGQIAAARAKPGSKPAGGVGVGVSLRVKIESIDRERDIVVFSLASGELIAHRLQTPQGREFVEGLKVGNVVQLDYAEAAALSIEKP